MIPDYEPKDMPDAIEFYTEMLRKLEVLSDTHRHWYTHKNPFGCWICDVFLLSNKVIDLYYPKSPLDIMNVSSFGHDKELSRDGTTS